MNKEEVNIPPRLELFSDAVFAIIITIMVLELHPPEGTGIADLIPLAPIFLAYTLSFVNVIIYWNNHHHLLKTMNKLTGRVMWSNAFLLFCLSLMPFTTSWMGLHPGETIPTALYAIVFTSAALAYTLLQNTIIAVEGDKSTLAKAIGSDRKGKLSLLGYILSIVFAFIDPLISYLLFTVVALMWIWPDKRIEKQIKKES